MRDDRAVSTTDLAAVSEFARLATRARDWDELMRTIVDRTTHVMGVEVCSFYLMDAEGERLTLAATNGLDVSQVGRVSLVVGAGITGRAAAERRPIESPDVTADPRFSWVRGLDLEGLHAMLSVPLRWHERVVGVLNVQTTAIRDFRPDEVELLSTIADILAGIVEKGRLQTEVEARLASLAALDEARAELLAVVTHELRTPLSVVRVYLDLLADVAIAHRASARVGRTGRASDEGGPGGADEGRSADERGVGDRGRSADEGGAGHERGADSGGADDGRPADEGGAADRGGADADAAAIDRIAEWRERAIEQVTRLDGLVDSILVSVHAEGLPELAREPFDIGAAVAATVETLRVLIRPHLLRWIPPATPLIGRGDEGRFRQVLEHLLENETKYAPVETAISLGAWRHDGEIRLYITDDGPGVPIADWERVFEPYVRAEARTGRGSGIGLFAARRLMDAMGGRVWIEANGYGGSRFVIAIPATD
jgi:signal transduction histidine kinase